MLPSYANNELILNQPKKLQLLTFGNVLNK